jgi:CBS domain-containing protein
MTTIEDIMTTELIAVRPRTTLQDAAAFMRDQGIGDVLVVGDDGRLEGIVTDRDVAIRGVAEGLDPATTAVTEVCTREDLIVLAPDDAVEDALRLVRQGAVRRLPVVADGRPVGIVSLGDLALQRDRGSVLADISAEPPTD